MCGIAGLLHMNGEDVCAERLQAMTDAMSHRGPDGEGHYVHGRIGLGHRRLAIIDLSPAGKQPMRNEDGTIWVTFNGEIYNFAEIRTELMQHGHEFHSHTDTEVIVHAYEQWGVECLARFNGMFAFGLWDEPRKRLWLVRDRLGIKPLYYAQIADTILFGSEIKALLTYPEFDREIDYEALAYFLALNYTPAPHTLFKHARQILPGHYLVIENGQLQHVEYWDVRYREDGYRSEDDYAEELRALLDSSVKLRLVSDVPFGAFLSGGIDSSTVVYWMSQHLQEPVKTFSVGFTQSNFDERPYAQKVAAFLHTDHREQMVAGQAGDLFTKLVWHAEEPLADSSMVAMYHVASLARQHVTMALSGDGADEIFAGYETYQAYYAHRLYRAIPSAIRQRVVEPLVDRLPVTQGKVAWDFKVRRFVKSGALNEEDAHASWRMIFNADARRALLKPLADKPEINADVVNLYRAAFAQTNARDPLNRMLYVDTRFYLPNDMLVKVDRMTMAHGLEAREPLLDYRLVEFAARLPPHLKLNQMRHKKYLLKKVMSKRLPDEILWRKKAGFNVPNAHWIKQEMKPYVTDCLAPALLKKMGWLDHTVVLALLKEHFENRADNSHQIWGLLTLAVWWQQFVEVS
ncbi:MAG: asparagine synthase (glutamine-hydrolyzing) [Anaerolineae bacterium]|nr:asparagine synthase (glutamine-hydrolyzing) [Anaerolineae bacterium]